jgi:hypothetical protein
MTRGVSNQCLYKMKPDEMYRNVGLAQFLFVFVGLDPVAEPLNTFLGNSGSICYANA